MNSSPIEWKRQHLLIKYNFTNKLYLIQFIVEMLAYAVFSITMDQHILNVS